MANLGLPEAELSLLLVDDRKIQELNHRFLGRDKPTNVLAFSMREGEYSSLHPNLLGDLVISIETTKRQSKQSDLNEMEMLTLVLQGSTNREIATKSSISERTVKTHLYRIYRKLKGKSRTKAIELLSHS